ncbi:MAG: DsrE family protein [Methanomicrobiales archaeon]
MTSHFFLLGERISQERLTWIEEVLKFYFLKLYPENLLHHTTPKEVAFTFLITGDALYSLNEEDTLPVWEIILSLPSVKIVCDRQELDLRGISIERLKMKNPEQLIDHNSMSLNGKTSFWKDVVKIARQTDEPLPSTIGYLQLESPYMHTSGLNATQCLAAAIEVRASIELYTYLDGVHLSHTNQNPTECQNIGATLEEMNDRAEKRGLKCQMLACSRCAAARGYSTWDDGKGVVISTCTIKPFRIRNLKAIIDRFECNHLILGQNAASITQKKEGPISQYNNVEKNAAPPVTILITKTPYGTEHAFGALSFAIACAYQGIRTQVVFIEDGVYSLTGNHRLNEETQYFNLQEVIEAVSESENLHLYAYLPSLHRRRITKNKQMTFILDIGKTELAQLLFHPSKSSQAGHQRVLFF